MSQQIFKGAECAWLRRACLQVGFLGDVSTWLEACFWACFLVDGVRAWLPTARTGKVNINITRHGKALMLVNYSVFAVLQWLWGDDMDIRSYTPLLCNKGPYRLAIRKHWVQQHAAEKVLQPTTALHQEVILHVTKVPLGR